MTAVQVPDAVGPIVGWRAWKIGSSGREEKFSERLSSIAFDCMWPARQPLKAECMQVSTRYCCTPPQKRCRCGIYAVHGPRQLLDTLYHERFQVVGEVSLWGKIVVARKGWRAEFAYPRRLFVISLDLKEAGRLADALSVYGVPVETASRHTVRSMPPAVPEQPGIWRRVLDGIFGVT